MIMFYKAIMLLVLVSSYAHSAYSQASNATPQLPKLFFEYSEFYDRICGQLPGNKLDDSWAKEAEQKQGYFSQIWSKSADAIWVPLFEKFRKGFGRTEYTVTLSVCPNTRSYSHPLVLNVARYLPSFTSSVSETIREDFRFVELMTHELLHVWTYNNLDYSKTPLMLKYKNEAEVTRNHIFVFALQYWMLEQSNQNQILNYLKSHYSSGQATKSYQRAWDIVQQEGVDKWLGEALLALKK